MTTDIYEQHAAAFKDVNAYLVLDNKGELIARVTFKSRISITCYLHIIGLRMTRGRASGGGYDRRSAAYYDAIMKTKFLDGADPKMIPLLKSMQLAAKEGDGASHWDRALRDNGFIVHQAV